MGIIALTKENCASRKHFLCQEFCFAFTIIKVLVISIVICISNYGCTNKGYGVSTGKALVVSEPIPLWYDSPTTKVIDTIFKNDTVRVIAWDCDKDFIWYKIRCHDKTGYIIHDEPMLFYKTGSQCDVPEPKKKFLLK